MKNMFSVLSNYGSGQAENYLTESLVLVLQQALQRAERKGWQLVDSIVGGALSLVEGSPASLEIDTQVTFVEGRPDIEIKIPGEFLAFVEVKHDAHLSEGQLKAYQAVLDRSSEATKSLVLLSRSKSESQSTALQIGQFQHLCWYEIHRFLSDLMGEDPTLDFLVSQFQGFLEEKQMSLQRIGWEYENGVSSLVEFTAMLDAAIQEASPDLKIMKTAGWTWRGFYIDKDTKDIFVGVRFESPTILSFENNGGTNATFERSLNFADVHFFSLSAGEQFETLIRFIGECLEDYSKFSED